ncbi:unnamed protein product [Ectocarpus sp. 4 AP-2014]
MHVAPRSSRFSAASHSTSSTPPSRGRVPLERHSEERVQGKCSGA